MRVLEVVLPRLEGPQSSRCDWRYVSKVVNRADPELEACVAHLTDDYETLDFRYRVDETEGMTYSPPYSTHPGQFGDALSPPLSTESSR
jgi:hypothetical protein